MNRPMEIKKTKTGLLLGVFVVQTEDGKRSWRV